MDDIDYGAVFGVEGGEAQEVAEPEEATEEQAQGAEEQEVAEPDAGDEESAKQTPEQNAAYAAARRKAEAERDAAIRKAQEEAQRTIDEAFKSSGLKNPFTGKPISSKAEFDAYMQQAGDARKSQLMEQAGLSEEEYTALVNDLPEVRQAREAREKAERAMRRADEAQAKAKIDEQIQEIGKLDPDIRELNDLAGMENYPQFYELVQKGNSLLDAYKLANFDKLVQKNAAAAKQAAYNRTQSKQHMGRTKERGAGAISVPNDVKEMYRAFNPDATDAEIQAHYNKNHKS